MKKDKLEKFVIENREGFNDLEVPPMLWNAIEKQTAGFQGKLVPAEGGKADSTNSPGKMLRIGTIAWRAAAAILIFASAWYLNDYFDKSPAKTAHTTVSPAPVTSPVMNELSDVEAYYTTQINSRQLELAKYSREHPEIIEDLKKEFLNLDKGSQELRKDLAESNADEKVVEAIIQSYRVKLDILEQMLSEMQKGRAAHSETTKTL